MIDQIRISSIDELYRESEMQGVNTLVGHSCHNKVAE